MTSDSSTSMAAETTRREHSVRFYESDDVLTDLVADFLAQGMVSGQSVLLIGTREHRRAVLAQLGARRIDVDSAQAHGRLAVLDSHELLSKLALGTAQVAVQFRQTIEDCLRGLHQNGASASTRAYADVFDVLWRSGDAVGAIELEVQWSELQRAGSHQFHGAHVLAGFLTHGGMLPQVPTQGSSPPTADVAATSVPAHVLASEIAQRIQIERTLRDSLQQLRAKEAALLQSEASLRDFVDHATVGLHWVGEDGTILWANRAELELLGYDAADYIGQPIARFHADTAVIGDILRRLTADERLYDYEATMVAKDGSFRHVLINSSVYWESGKFVHTRCFTRDVTARKHAEEALRESERRLQTITDLLPVLVTYVDNDERYRFINAAYQSWVGRSPGELLGLHLRDVLGEPGYAAVKPYMAAALSGQTVTYQAVVPYRGAGDRVIDATLVPHHGPDGQVAGCIALIADISERKRLEDARAESQRRTERLLGVTAAIADAITPAQVFEAVVDRVGSAIGASSAALWLVDADAREMRLARATGYAAAAQQRLEIVSLDLSHSFPALDCVLRSEPVWIDSQAELLEQYPHLHGLATAGRTYRIACLPILARGKMLGSLGMTFDHAPPIDEDERGFLLVVARYTAQALERLRLLDAERTSRERAEAAAVRTAVLSHASRTFSEAGPGLHAVLDAVAAHVTESHADICGIYLMPESGEELEVGAVRHRDPEVRAEVLRLLMDRPIRLGEGVLGGVAGTGQHVFLPDVDRDSILAMSAPAYRDWVARHLPRSMIAVPLQARGTIIGVLHASRQEGSPSFTVADFELLRELGDRAALALENARLSRDDKHARERAELLYGLARAVISAETINDVFAGALDAIGGALDTTRASVLSFDVKGVMRFRAWRGLSDAYRAAVEGHTPWSRDTRDARPIVVEDVENETSLAEHLPVFRSEGIRALAFIPLMAGHEVLGKFMVYYPSSRRFAQSELDLARAIADHVAAAMTRFAAIAELRETVRFNEMFTGMLGHDLRNPLGAIVTAAQLALTRSESDRLIKPLSRIMTSSARMTRMIEQLLDFTRVRLGSGIPLSPRELDVVPLIQQVIDELDDAHPEWSLRLEHVGNTVGEWDGDRLAQVFSNLMANSLQHGVPSGGVLARIDGTDEEALRIDIHNMGVIPPELVARLFEPLAGGKRPLAKSRGLGLGLYITREIVKSHGGTIQVHSDHASGTMFSIGLPRTVGRPPGAPGVREP